MIEVEEGKRMFKKTFQNTIIITFLLGACLVVLVSLVSCGFHQTKDTDSDTENKTTDTAASGQESQTDTDSNQTNQTKKTSKIPTTTISPYTETYHSSNIGIAIIDGERVSFDISVIDNRAVTLQLVRLADSYEQATAWSISISGCESTYSPTFNHLSGDYYLYRGDLNCVAGLESFTLDSLSWTKSGGGVCSGPAGTICGFENGDDKLIVTINDQLNLGGITNNEAVTFTIKELTQGDDLDMTVDDVSDDDVSYTVEGFRAPYVTDLFYTHFESADVNGRGLFTFRVDCKDAIYKGHATDREQWYCFYDFGQSMIEYDLCLVDFDDYTLPLDAVSAATLFTNCDSEKLYIVTTNIKDSSDTGWGGRNGGIEFALQGPANMYANRDMILVIKYNDSFRYWKVNIDDLD